jgi:hypothetical protein
MLEIDGIITNWFLASLEDPAVEKPTHWKLVGYIYNSKIYKDGTRIEFNYPQQTDLESKIVLKDGTGFKLGNVDEQFKRYWKAKMASDATKKFDFLGF